MNTYHIVDEPKARFYTRFIVNPLVILFASIFLPLLISLPFYGQFWGPIIWILINGFLLGSPTFKHEVIIAAVGVIAFLSLPSLSLFLFTLFDATDTYSKAVPYLRTLSQAIFFMTLYLIVFKQSVSYSILSYLKELNQS